MEPRYIPGNGDSRKALAEDKRRKQQEEVEAEAKRSGQFYFCLSPDIEKELHATREFFPRYDFCLEEILKPVLGHSSACYSYQCAKEALDDSYRKLRAKGIKTKAVTYSKENIFTALINAYSASRLYPDDKELQRDMIAMSLTFDPVIAIGKSADVLEKMRSEKNKLAGDANVPGAWPSIAEPMVYVYADLNAKAPMKVVDEKSAARYSLFMIAKRFMEITDVKNNPSMTPPELFEVLKHACGDNRPAIERQFREGMRDEILKKIEKRYEAYPKSFDAFLYVFGKAFHDKRTAD